MNYSITPFSSQDLPGVVALWNACCAAGDVVYSPVTAGELEQKLLQPGMLGFVAKKNDQTIGFVHGASKTAFLPGQTAENTPGYLTVILVDAAHRRQGVGTALLQALTDAFLQQGKSMMACSGDNPVKLAWRVPGTPGHDHNNAPGVDEDCAGYTFLQQHGFAPKFHEVAMYLDLQTYQPAEDVIAAREKLTAEGVYTGRYTPDMQLNYDGMCDRVGSEYWRNVIKTEIAAWQSGTPNQDDTLWVDGVPPKGPRPMLIAAVDGNMAGFTGPVDLQKSGRGWFTGICADPMYGRRGIGSVLFDLLMREFIAEGAAFSTLFTGAENHAQRVYQRAGFDVVRRFCVMTRALTDGADYAGKHF